MFLLICWVLVFKIKLGIKGAALAISISNWVNVLLLAIYVRFSQAFVKTWTGFSKESLHDILSFIKIAVPSAIMIWSVFICPSPIICFLFAKKMDLFIFSLIDLCA